MSTGNSTFLSVREPTFSIGRRTLFRTWSNTGPDTQIPPGSAKGSIREGDVHRVPHDVVLLPDDVPYVDPDPENDALPRGGECVPSGHRLLDFHCASHRLHRAREFDQEPVAERLDLPTPMRGEERSNDRLVLRAQPQGLLLVALAQFRESYEVGEHDRGETPGAIFHVPRTHPPSVKGYERGVRAPDTEPCGQCSSHETRAPRPRG